MQITKALISLCACTGWSAPLLFANDEDRFSHMITETIILENMVTTHHGYKDNLLVNTILLRYTHLYCFSKIPFAKLECTRLHISFLSLLWILIALLEYVPAIEIKV